MKYGYICSRTKEAVFHYRRFLKEWGAEEITVDVENYTMCNSMNESLSGLLESMKPGDSLFVMRLEHLSRNLDKLKEILETLQRKEISLFVNGVHVDFNNENVRKDLEENFRLTREIREEMKARTEAFIKNGRIKSIQSYSFRREKE